MAEALGAAGVKVAVLDINMEKADARSLTVIQCGGTAKAFRCDVLDAVQVRECYEAVCSLGGPPHFLINGAGGNDPRGSASEEFHGPTGSSRPVAQSFFDGDSAPGSAKCLTSISWGRFSSPRPFPVVVPVDGGFSSYVI